MQPDFQDHSVSHVALRALVRSMWSLRYGGEAAHLDGLIGPDSQVEFVFQTGDPCRLQKNGVVVEAPRSLVYGLRHGMLRMLPDGANTLVSFRVAPAVASVILGQALNDCWDRPVDLVEIIGDEASRLLERIATSPRAMAGEILEAWLISRLSDWGSDEWRQLALQQRLLSQFADDRLSKLADEIGVTTRTLRRYCERHAGLSPKQLVMSGRMLRGCILLRDRPNMAIAEISGGLGFNDQPAFTNAFRHYVGMTPAKLRAEPLVFCALP